MLDVKTIFDPDRTALTPAPLPGMTPADLPPDWHLAWDERAGIMEYDGGLPRKRAEAAALTEIQRQMRAALPITPCRCRACMNNNDACTESK
jgi:hypothetical protein